jgi:hypothetical protein
MATASTTSATKAKAKARKPAAKASAQRARPSARRATQSRASVKPAQTATRDTAQVVGDYAERAVLIPVGAALIARDRVVSSVSDTISTYSSTSRAQQQLRRFERRGATARNRLEREVRKARVRVERELRQRRRVIESTVSDIDGRRERITKNSGELANRVPELANRVQERILSLV